MKKFLIILSLSLFALSSFGIMATEADARAGGGKSFGNIGSRNYTAPQTMNKANTGTPAAIGSGMGRFAGLAGAAIVGALIAVAAMAMFQNGMLSGILFYALIAIVAFMIFAFIRSRRSPLLANPGMPQAFHTANNKQPDPALHSTAIHPPASHQPPAEQPTIRGTVQMGETNLENVYNHIRESDPKFYPAIFLSNMDDIFMRIQEAWRDKDIGYMELLVTPEIEKVFASQMQELREKNLVNYMRNIKLLEKSIVEAWIEKGHQYITVHLRFSMLDYTINTNGDVVDGSKDIPAETSELWTFTRDDGNPHAIWKLSAITQD
jgi:predicted lipid-binding transport protein (Tim44 family)